jgi:hypothetical protein
MGHVIHWEGKTLPQKYGWRTLEEGTTSRPNRRCRMINFGFSECELNLPGARHIVWRGIVNHRTCKSSVLLEELNDLRKENFVTCG